ncbi:type I-E CRISPR-associated protein Cas6/Cse3/CasE [Marinithermus hydrothermalis]|uniref:CRISPR-associated protein, Cse3 family n=1 Tax=Marinithermus hydrothermalis (strain DSM 14884 / JCM 11576 / T1) TaxID=869210 RepID=F2NLA6_MARHT|nr:type I-E CRISPR-associated protein Cas6/Cse3/CasE [Marinithermus hydrothermalis]AEB11725.1 CRISPR-associated protein, Cse3 family [Marinithermus hydrothermalis DSM 14884]
MWISKLVLNPRSKAVRRDLANPYEMHRTLSRAVAEALGTQKERLLWRLEPTRATEPPVVLVQTLTEPNWGALETDYYAEVFPPKPFNPHLRPGQTLRFRLRANPAKRVARTGKRIALKNPEEKLAWLARRLEEGGFRLLGGENGYRARILQDVFLEARKKEALLQVQAVLFEGILEVLDPEKARATLERGVGPGKALGLGLLSLAP